MLKLMLAMCLVPGLIHNIVIRESVQFWKTRNNIRLNENRLGHPIFSDSTNKMTVLKTIGQ